MSALVGLLALVVVLALCWYIPESRSLRQQWRLLVPFAVGWVVCQLLTLLSLQVALLGLRWELPFGLAWTGVNLSVLGILLTIVEVSVAALATPLLLHAARGERVGNHLGPTLRAVPRRWLRMFGALAIGYLPLLLAVGLLGAAVSRGWIDTEPVILVLGFLALVVFPLWSSVSGSLVFDAIDEDVPFVAAVQRSFRTGYDNFLDWYRWVFAQAVVAGALVVLPNALAVNVMWSGGYSANNFWFAKASAIGPHPLAIVIGPLLYVAMVLLGLSIKLRCSASCAGMPCGGAFQTKLRRP